MNLSDITLHIDGQRLYLAGALILPRLRTERMAKPESIKAVVELQLSSEFMIWAGHQNNNLDQLKADFDYQIRKPDAVRQISRQIVALREKCNFRVIRERANLLLLWQLGGHYYRDMSPSVIACEFHSGRTVS